VVCRWLAWEAVVSFIGNLVLVVLLEARIIWNGQSQDFKGPVSDGLLHGIYADMRAAYANPTFRDMRRDLSSDTWRLLSFMILFCLNRMPIDAVTLWTWNPCKRGEMQSSVGSCRPYKFTWMWGTGNSPSGKHSPFSTYVSPLARHRAGIPMTSKSSHID
jgi:hypothetical protein